jgi:DNA polymerase III psi subunit
MEGELDPSCAQDMERLLKNSPGDRKRLERLWRAKKLIKEADEVLLTEDAREYDRLHDQIMSAIERATSVSEEKETNLAPDQAERLNADETKMSWTLALLVALAPSLARRYSFKM